MMTEALQAALWRYVSRDECDCECGPDDGIHDPGDGIPCRCSGDPCPYCEGSAVLTAAGVRVLDTGLCEEGRHFQQVYTRLRATPPPADLLDQLAEAIGAG